MIAFHALKLLQSSCWQQHVRCDEVSSWGTAEVIEVVSVGVSVSSSIGVVIAVRSTWKRYICRISWVMRNGHLFLCQSLTEDRMSNQSDRPSTPDYQCELPCTVFFTVTRTDPRSKVIWTTLSLGRSRARPTHSAKQIDLVLSWWVPPEAWALTYRDILDLSKCVQSSQTDSGVESKLVVIDTGNITDKDSEVS